MRDEDKLIQLWVNLKPKQMELDWQEIGFQSQDPSKDFRGVGILALDLLLKITSPYSKFYAKALEFYQDSQNKAHWYFFAQTGLHITKKLAEEFQKSRKYDILILEHIDFLLEI